jgi:protoporphyrinogen/coproporphyrinogen III oxidase
VSSPPDVVIVGAGITGLVAAYELTGAEGGPTPSSPRVTILEAGGRPGGKVAGLEFGDRVLDAGPDGALARRPELASLSRQLGIEDRLRPIGASGASVFARGRLRTLPEGLVLGVPTDPRSLRRAKVLSRRGMLRAQKDVTWPSPPTRGPLGDRPIGPLVAAKLGQEVVDVLVDPTVGGIAAGRVAEMSAAAVFPGLLDAAQRRGSLMKAMQAQLPSARSDGEPPGPAFCTLEGGMHALVEALVAVLESRGVSLVLGAEVTGLLRRAGSTTGWSVDTSATTTSADGVIVCTPAPAAARLLAPHEAEVASLLEQIDYSSVAIATFAFEAASIALPEHGTGALVPSGSVVPSGARRGEAFLTTALTFLDRKWPHLARPGEVTLRVHCGKIDDERPGSLDDHELMEALVDELGSLVHLEARPVRRGLVRWPSSLPQYRVHHLVRVAGIEAGIERLDGIELAGAALKGVGVPACIEQGRAAAQRLLSGLSAS